MPRPRDDLKKKFFHHTAQNADFLRLLAFVFWSVTKSLQNNDARTAATQTYVHASPGLGNCIFFFPQHVSNKNRYVARTFFGCMCFVVFPKVQKTTRDAIWSRISIGRVRNYCVSYGNYCTGGGGRFRGAVAVSKRPIPWTHNCRKNIHFSFRRVRVSRISKGNFFICLGFVSRHFRKPVRVLHHNVNLVLRLQISRATYSVWFQ